MLREILGVIGYVALFAALLFLPRGNLHSWRAWVLLALLLVVRLVGAMTVYRLNPGLLAERHKLPIQSGQPLADRILLPLLMAAFAGLVAFAGYDSQQPRLGAPGPIWAAAGLTLFLAGWLLTIHVLAVNAHAVTVVRHQGERHQAVVDHGAYRIVRHPMYAGLIVVMVGLGLWMGSWAAALASGVPAILLTLRIVVEERLLRRHLPGYGSYTARVRYRLLPGIW
jgi:protein-S-isoprenylcysteine O-methyltransferase Ste14